MSLSPEDADELMFQIGDKNELEWDNAIKMAGAVASACVLNKHANVSLMMGGYDDDPREIYEIPEAVTYIQVFVNALKMITEDRPDVYEDIRRRLTPESIHWREVN